MESVKGPNWAVFAAAGILWVGFWAFVLDGAALPYPAQDAGAGQRVVVSFFSWLSAVIGAGLFAAAFGLEPGASIADPLKRTGRLLLAGSAVAAALVLPMVVVVALGPSIVAMFALIGYLVFVFWALARTLLHIPLIMLEGHEAMAALQRSMAISKGHALVILIPILALGLLGSILGRVWRATDTAAGLAFFLEHVIVAGGLAAATVYLWKMATAGNAPQTVASPATPSAGMPEPPVRGPQLTGVLPSAAHVEATDEDAELPARLSEDPHARGGVLLRVAGHDDVELMDHLGVDAKPVVLVDSVSDGVAEEALLRGAVLVAARGLEPETLDAEGFDRQMFGSFDGDRITLFSGGAYVRDGDGWALQEALTDVDVDQAAR